MHKQILTSGTAQLATRAYEPESEPARVSVVIGGAMGVRQDYYAPFAEWLAGQGFRVTTFDYRGSGESLPDTVDGGLRGFRADLVDWASDYEAVVDSAKAALPGAPLYLLGHSLGAQLPGFLKNQAKVDGMLSIAAGSGYWRENAPQLKRIVLYFWWVLVPLATRLFGYFPGRKLGKVGDVPAGVIMQWRRWCLDPEYSVGAEGEVVRQGYAAVTFPILALAIGDDELITLRSTQSLMGWYRGARPEIRQIEPADFGAARIGHFGIFRNAHKATLWPSMAAAIAGLAIAVTA